MIAKAEQDTPQPIGFRARLAALVESLRCFREDVSDTVVSWWYCRFPGGPSVPLEDVKKRYGL